MLNLRSNTQFDGKYTLLERIGIGGFAEVWKARRSTGFIQALKIFTSLDQEGVNMARQEFERVYNLSHSKLLKPTDYGVYGNHPYLVLPYCAKGNVSKHAGRLSEEDLAKLIYDISSALEYLHGMRDFMIHQDIKPDNILLDDRGHYLLSDFGISRRFRRTLVKSRNNTRYAHQSDSPSVGVAHPAYRAPELFADDGRNREPVKASDIWSLGATVFELACKELPFGEFGGLIQQQGQDCPELPATYSKYFNRLVVWCLAEEPWDRPTAAQLRTIAEDYLASGVWRLPKNLKPHQLRKVKQNSAKNTDVLKNPIQSIRNSIKNKPREWAIAASVLVLIAIGLGAWSFVGGNEVKKFARAFEEGNRLMSQKEFDKASDQFDEAYQIDQENNDLITAMSICEDSVQTGVYRLMDEGQKWELEGDNIKALNAYNVLLVQYDDEHAEAQQAVSRLNSFAKKCVEENRKKAKASFDNKQFVDALQFAQDGLNCDPENQELTNFISRIEENKDNYAFESLVESARREIAQNNFPKAMTLINQAKSMKGQTPEINILIADYDNRLEEVYLSKIGEGKKQLGNGNCDRAVALLKEAIEIAPNRQNARDWMNHVEEKCRSKKDCTLGVGARKMIKVKCIELTDNFTKVTMQLYNNESLTASYSIYGPSSPEYAFHLKDEYNRLYRLRDISGDIGFGENQQIAPGASRTFHLYFDRIPDDTRRISLKEGTEHLQRSQNYWTFNDIKLDWQ